MCIRDRGYAVLGLSLLLTLGVAVFLVLYLLIVRPPVEPNICLLYTSRCV